MDKASKRNFMMWYLSMYQDTDWDMPLSELQHRFRRAECELFKAADIERTLSDTDLFEIYSHALKRLLDLRDTRLSSQLRRYLVFFDDFADDWCRCVRTNIDAYDRMVDSLTDSLYYRLLYIFRNGLLLSSAVALHFGSVLRENPSVVRTLLLKKTLRVCSVGGGSASDLVGLISVLESIAKRKGKVLDVRVTVVDSDARWKNACLAILGCLGQFRGAMWKIDFIEADVSCKNIEGKVTRAVKNSDIVMMVKFLSEFQSSHLDLKKTIKYVAASTPPGSLLFVLDSSDADLMRACGGQTGKMEEHDLVYEDTCYLHTLDLDAVGEVILAYQRHLASLQCNTGMKVVFVRIWSKTSPEEGGGISDSELRFRLRRNLDQYNLKDTLVHELRFVDWRERFSDDMSRMGWSRAGIEKTVAGKEAAKMRGQIFFTILKLSMDLDAEDLDHVAEKSGGRKITELFDEEDWESYLEDKSDFAEEKQSFYRMSVLGLYNHITRTKNFS